MRPGAIVLCHGPLEGPHTWRPVAERLAAARYRVLVPEVLDDERPPYAQRWVARMTLAVEAAQLLGPLVLVAAGSAGPLLPPLGAALRAGRREIGAYLLVDAPPPAPFARARLDLLRAADPVLAWTARRALLEPGRTWPLPGQAARPRGLDFWLEPLPMGVDWPESPCAYLDSGAGGPLAGWAIATALARGFTVAPVGPDPAGCVAGMATALAGW